MLEAGIKDGAMASITVTVIDAVLVLPAASLKVYVMVVMPLLKVLIPTCPDVAERVVAPVMVKLKFPTVQLSPMVASGTETDFVQPDVIFTEMFDDGVIEGA